MANKFMTEVRCGLAFTYVENWPHNRKFFEEEAGREMMPDEVVNDAANLYATSYEEYVYISEELEDAFLNPEVQFLINGWRNRK